MGMETVVYIDRVLTGISVSFQNLRVIFGNSVNNGISGTISVKHLFLLRISVKYLH